MFALTIAHEKLYILTAIDETRLDATLGLAPRVC
jgi:hypothetical protein